MDRPIDSHWPPPLTIFSQVLDPSTKGQEKTSITVGISQWAGVPRPQGRASPFISTQLSTCLDTHNQMERPLLMYQLLEE